MKRVADTLVAVADCVQVIMWVTFLALPVLSVAFTFHFGAS